MFRKPKSYSGNKKTTFRKIDKKNVNGIDQKTNEKERNGDVQSSVSVNRKRFRRRDDSSDEEEESNVLHSSLIREKQSLEGVDTDEEEGQSTSALLQQIQMEKRRKTSGRNSDKNIFYSSQMDDLRKKHRLGTTTVNNKQNRKVMHNYQSDPTAVKSGSELATRTAEYHPEEKTDVDLLCGIVNDNELSSSKNISRNNNNNNNSKHEEGKEKIYTGHKVERNKFLAGPLKAPTFVRTTCRFDYQPDICKDYKETGFCGFGDTCIYLHDRGDTVSGWQLEKQWEDRKKAEREAREKEMNRFAQLDVDHDSSGNGDTGSNVPHTNNDGLPFACFLCRNAFQNPVVTVCGHYFCQSCILNHVRKTSSNACPVCNKDTHAVFNHPTKLESKKRKMVGSRGSWEDFKNRNTRNK